MNVSFTELPDLACELLGGQCLEASDEFFAPKENLIKASSPIFIADQYTDCGKWMDGWESRRKRASGNDWCTLKLGARATIRGVNVDTSYFNGNFPEYCSIDALGDASGEGGAWRPLLSKVPLRGGGPNLFAIYDSTPVSRLRLNIFPDGGVARFRVFGEVVPKLQGTSLIDLAAILNGGTVVSCSDMFFSHKNNLILPGRSQFMGGGWETKRRRGPGNDWIVIRFARAGVVKKIEIDTDHYKGNYPETASVEGALVSGPTDVTAISFAQILPRVALGPDRQQAFEKEITSQDPINTVRLSIYPDGGIARFRVFACLA